MKLREIRGLKYPDDFVIKFFFKNRLNARAGRVIELGCGNGNNLMLFHEYGWDVTGVDISARSLADAEFNFGLEQPAPAQYRFVRCDFARGLRQVIRGKFDVILLPNFLNYLLRDQAVAVLRAVRRQGKAGTHFFLRSRSVRDYRHRRGRLVKPGSFRMTTDETGERGLLNTCYREYELVDMVRNELRAGLDSLQVFSIDAESLHGGLTELNSDIVVWGTMV